jgi:hypothetical protein
VSIRWETALESVVPNLLTFAKFSLLLPFGATPDDVPGIGDQRHERCEGLGVLSPDAIFGIKKPSS